MKLRVVVNVPYKTQSGLRLNDELLKGLALQNELLFILVMF